MTISRYLYEKCMTISIHLDIFTDTKYCSDPDTVLTITVNLEMLHTFIQYSFETWQHGRKCVFFVDLL